MSNHKEIERDETDEDDGLYEKIQERRIEGVNKLNCMRQKKQNPLEAYLSDKARFQAAQVKRKSEIFNLIQQQPEEQPLKRHKSEEKSPIKNDKGVKKQDAFQVLKRSQSLYQKQRQKQIQQTKHKEDQKKKKEELCKSEINSRRKDFIQRQKIRQKEGLSKQKEEYKKEQLPQVHHKIHQKQKLQQEQPQPKEESGSISFYYRNTLAKKGQKEKKGVESTEQDKGPSTCKPPYFISAFQLRQIGFKVNNTSFMKINIAQLKRFLSKLKASAEWQWKTKDRQRSRQKNEAGIGCSYEGALQRIQKILHRFGLTLEDQGELVVRKDD